MESDLNIIEAFDKKFAYSKARDFEVIIDLETDYINYSKLCYLITEVDDKFKALVRFNCHKFNNIIYAKDTDKLLKVLDPDDRRKVEEMSRGRILPLENIKKILEIINSYKFTMDKYVELGIFYTISGGKDVNIRGTYGPRYLIDFIIQMIKPMYIRLREVKSIRLYF